MSRGYIQIAQFHEEAALGKQYIYLAGSTDLATVYDPVSGDPISNPVSIGSDGYVQAFEVDDSTMFDIRVVSFAGTTLFTRSNISVLGGTSGDVGPQGPRGLKGEKGDTGDTGAAGTNGTNGIDGIDGEDGEDGVSLVSIRVDETSTTGKVLYNKSDAPSNWINAGSIMPGGIGQIKIDSGDSLGYLGSKLEAGEGISIGQPSSTTTLTITNTEPETYKTKASPYSTVKDFLNAIIEGTSGVTVSTSADFNKIIISGAGIGGSGFTPKGEWNDTTTYVAGDGVWYYDDSVSPVINRYYVASATNTNSNPYAVGTGWVLMFSIDQLGDQMVKLDASDSTTGFLLSKIVAGQGITFTRTVDAGGDFITIDGTPVFSVGVNGTDKTISQLSNVVDLVDGEVTEAVWDGNTIKVNHDTSDESGTAITQTATGLPKFDAYGHYKGASDAIEIGDITGLGGAIAAAGDGKVAIETGDAKGYMMDKLSATGAVNMEISGTVGKEIMTVVGTGKIACEAYDAVGYAEDKIIAGSNITVAKVDGPRGKALAISADLPEQHPLFAGKCRRYQKMMQFTDNSFTHNKLFVVGKTADDWAFTDIDVPGGGKVIDMCGGAFASGYDAEDGSFSLPREGIFSCVFSAHAFVSTASSYPVYFQLSVVSSYDNFVTYSSESAMQMTLEEPMTYQENMDNFTLNALVNNVADGLGRYKKIKFYVNGNAPSGSHYMDATFRNTYVSINEVANPQAVQGPKGDKGDKGDPGTAGEATLDGLLTFPIILSNTNISTGHTGEQGATYASSRVIAAASVEANYMSCFFTQVGTFYGLRMGIYLPGPAGDTLVAQTEVCTDTPPLGICTMPLTRDGSGNLLTETLYLDPNTSYMPAVIIKANATNLAAYEGISTNPPNHFGRYDSWNATAPTNLMPLTAAFSQSNTFPWLAISK